MPLNAFHMPKVEPRFIEEMKVVMPYLPNLGLGDPYVKEDEWPAEFFFLSFCMNSYLLFLSFSLWNQNSWKGHKSEEGFFSEHLSCLLPVRPSKRRLHTMWLQDSVILSSWSESPSELFSHDPLVCPELGNSTSSFWATLGQANHRLKIHCLS